MAHAGVGSVSFTTCLLLNSILGVKPTGVPFNGTGPAMNALIGGQVDYMCDQIVNAGAAGQGRHDQGLCHRHAGAQSGAAGGADHQGSRPAGVPGAGLERAVRAEGHAAADPRQADRRAATRRWTTRACASACSISAASLPDTDRARPAGARRAGRRARSRAGRRCIKAGQLNRCRESSGYRRRGSGRRFLSRRRCCRAFGGSADCADSRS